MTYKEFHTELGKILEKYPQVGEINAEVYEPHSWGSPNISKIELVVNEKDQAEVVDIMIYVEED